MNETLWVVIVKKKVGHHEEEEGRDTRKFIQSVDEKELWKRRRRFSDITNFIFNQKDPELQGNTVSFVNH